MYKLHTYSNNPRAQKALIAAEYAQVSVEVPPFEMGKDNKTPEFLKLFPLGKVSYVGLFYCCALIWK